MKKLFALFLAMMMVFSLAACGEELPEGQKFCPNCGTAVPQPKITCPGCGKEYEPGTRFCMECGTKL